MADLLSNLVHDSIGLWHLVSALIALVTGTAVLVMRKGTQRHRWVGYGYVGSMTVMLVTAFSIYRVFDGFGLFHVFAVVSTGTLIAGMVPAWRRGPNWQSRHLGFMYWSVMGLYGALAAELLARLPSTPFFTTIGLVVAGVMILGEIGWRRFGPHWLKTWAPKARSQTPDLTDVGVNQAKP